ncbi:TonB-dependent receptor plug domain-containing protein [Pontibacter qinzhouensis]|uniref:TonB-dependent receptor plug domain-containing protein n=1 Tax=Pontibacter qinzhouensis TaxID=2603253 RepID=UPI00210802B1|nr:TonB-dependent receptor plug domain-containing protein [Pontibacter qinzhouensis]
MQVNKILLLGILCALSLLAHAQQGASGTIAGKVTYPTGEPFAGATIRVAGTTTGAVTDPEGAYALSVPAGTPITIHVTAVGQVAQQKEVTLKNGQQLRLDFELKENAHLIKGVTVVGKTEINQIREQAYNVTAIDATKLHNSTLDLSHALDKVAGVRVRETGGVGSSMNFSLNGFTGRQVKFFLDGVPMDNFGSSFQLNNIPVNLAERIEVYKGVVPIWLGSDALGGAVNIVTSSAPRSYLDASYSFGSFNTHRSVLNAGYVANSGFTLQVNAFQNYSDNNYWVDVDVADINTGKYYPNQRVRRFHNTYHNETVIAKVGVVGKPYADKLFLGVTLGQNYSEIQTGARLVSVFGDWHRKGNIVMPTLQYQKRNLLTKGLDVTLNANYNLGTEQNIDTVYRRYNWFGDYKQYEGAGSERSRSMYKYSNNNGLLTANLNYQLGQKQTLSLNHVYNTFDRKGSDELYPENNSYEQPRKSLKNITGFGYKFDYNERWSSTAFVKH